MAYFSNSSEGSCLDNECLDCILNDKPCPILLVQATYNYEACNNKTASEILNCLVKEKDTGEYVGCQMKALLE